MRWKSNIPIEIGSAVFSDDESMIAAVVLDNEAVVVLDADSGELRWCLLSGDESESVVIDGAGHLIYGELSELDRRSSVLSVIEDDLTELRSVSDVLSVEGEITP